MATPRLQPAYELRPLGLGELLDYTFRLYQRVFPFVIIPLALVVGPFYLPTFFFLGIFQETTEAIGTDNASFAEGIEIALDVTGVDLTFLLGWGASEWILAGVALFGLSILYSVAYSVVQVGVVSTVGQRVLGIVPSTSAILSTYRRFGWRAIGLSLAKIALMVLVFILPVGTFAIGAATSSGSTGGGIAIMIIGMLLLFVAYVLMIWLVYVLYFAEPSLVIEDLGVIPAIRRSLALVSGSWWRVFGIMLVMGLLVQVLVSIVSGMANLVLMAIFPTARLVIYTLSQTMLSLFAMPLTLILIVLLYFDIRVRNEQFDLYHLLGRLDPAPTQPAASPEPPAQQL